MCLSGHRVISAAVPALSGVVISGEGQAGLQVGSFQKWAQKYIVVATMQPHLADPGLQNSSGKHCVGGLFTPQKHIS